MLKHYYQLTKPGIIRGNLLTAAGGALLASGREYEWATIAGLLAGITLVIAGACVTNNITDIGIDRRMTRTKQRPLVTGEISVRSAALLAVLLLGAGLGILLSTTNLLTTSLGAFGYFAYVVLYGKAKRKNDYGTLVGSISGAVPIVAGYTAVRGELDAIACLLAIAMITWQMAHFYAIGIYRKTEYAAANIPILPITRGNEATRQQILNYIILFTAACVLLTLNGETGYVFLIVMLIINLRWLRLASKKIGTNQSAWGKAVFIRSLFVITTFSILLMTDSYLA